ncbi:MAG: glyoxylate/hydroxypyruvate reductase A [Thiotrichales bacterium]|nr:glyoxylate/hydroxypyruvate reductase A [Thiotrichales bacterium]
MALVFHSLDDDPAEWERELKTLNPALDYRVWPDVGNVEDIDVALVWRAPPGMLKSLTHVKLLLSLGVGVDHLLNDPDLPDVPIARLVDDFCNAAMSEYVVLQVMRFLRDDPLFREQQRNHSWVQHPPRLAADTRVGILGLGTLGGAAAERLVALGFQVSGWSKNPKTVAGVTTYHGSDGLSQLLATTDIAVCLLALTDETRDIVNRHTLDQMPRGGYFINAGRGHHVVEADLLKALDDDHLAGVALDCFRDEPLPENSPFWDHPKVVMTPHSSTGTNAPSAARHVTENVRRFHAGEPLLNELNRDAGY